MKKFKITAKRSINKIDEYRMMKFKSDMKQKYSFISFNDNDFLTELEFIRANKTNNIELSNKLFDVYLIQLIETVFKIDPIKHKNLHIDNKLSMRIEFYKSRLRYLKVSVDKKFTYNLCYNELDDVRQHFFKINFPTDIPDITCKIASEFKSKMLLINPYSLKYNYMTTDELIEESIIYDNYMMCLNKIAAYSFVDKLPYFIALVQELDDLINQIQLQTNNSFKYSIGSMSINQIRKPNKLNKQKIDSNLIAKILEVKIAIHTINMTKNMNSAFTMYIQSLPFNKMEYAKIIIKNGYIR